jgi:hypothetical protein
VAVVAAVAAALAYELTMGDQLVCCFSEISVAIEDWLLDKSSIGVQSRLKLAIIAGSQLDSATSSRTFSTVEFTLAMLIVRRSIFSRVDGSKGGEEVQPLEWRRLHFPKFFAL